MRSLLPRGRTLPDEVWRPRHVGIVGLLWVHAAVIPVFALVRGFSVGHSIVETLAVPLTAGVAMWPSLSRRVRTAVASVGLLTCSAVLVHLSGGSIEMHFHFFVMVAVVALYQDWVPFLTAVGYVFVHHGLFGALAPQSVFNHVAGRNDPWRWAAIHAFFILGISAACLVTWRLNESIAAQQRRAEERLREESRIVESLHRVGTMLAEDLDAQRVLQAVTDAATELTRASFGAFFYNVADDVGESYMLFTLSGAPVEAFQRFGLPRNTPIFAPTFSGETVVRLDDVTADPRYGTMAPHHGMPEGHLPVRSYLAVPVRSRTGTVLGGLFFGHPEEGQFTEVDERIVVGIASQASMAIDNVQLYEAERRARTQSEAARVRVSVLAEAGRILTSTLEVDELLVELARLLTSSVADYCSIELVDDDGVTRRLTVAATADDHWIRTADLDSPEGAALPTVIRCMQATHADIVVDGATDCVRGMFDEASYHRAVDRDGVAAAVVAPLRAHEHVLGVLIVATAQKSDRWLDVDDVSYVEELARRTATAVENAHLFSRQRSVAETLQHSLLPDRLPIIPGLTAAARYLPGGPDVEIGGDWYDIIPLPHGRLGVAMGDVVGRGERAAALMGQLRSSVRAYAFDGKSPTEIMERLNDVLLEGGPEQMATVVYAELDMETTVLRYVNAGHPPPLLSAPDGVPTFLAAASGPPIGAAPGQRYTEGKALLPPASTLVLYTDGLVEDRDLPLDVGLTRLQSAVHLAPDEPEQLCSSVVRETMADRAHQDDAAILAIRLAPLGDVLDLQLPSQPQILAPLRAVLRRWLSGIGANEQEIHDVVLATMEVCTNAIRHARAPVDSTFELHADVDDGVRVSVRDRGRWREPGGTVGGRGLMIAAACVDTFDVLPTSSGTEVRLTRRLGTGAPLVV